MDPHFWKRLRGEEVEEEEEPIKPVSESKVIRDEILFTDCQSAFDERPRPRKVAPGLERWRADRLRRN